MLRSFREVTAALFLFCALLSLSTARAAERVGQPSVARRTIVCDGWQWIGNGATTWGCLFTPHEAFVAGGKATDDVVADLQRQIDALTERLNKIEHK